MIIDWNPRYWLIPSEGVLIGPVFFWPIYGKAPNPNNTAPELINQSSINNYEPRSIALPGTITVGGGFQL